MSYLVRGESGNFVGLFQPVHGICLGLWLRWHLQLHHAFDQGRTKGEGQLPGHNLWGRMICIWKGRKFEIAIDFLAKMSICPGPSFGMVRPCFWYLSKAIPNCRFRLLLDNCRFVLIELSFTLEQPRFKPRTLRPQQFKCVKIVDFTVELTHCWQKNFAKGY